MNVTVSAGQPLDAASLNAISYASETTPSTKSKKVHSNFRTKTRERGSKASEIPPVTFIRMEQLAPKGAMITNNDGKYHDNRRVFCACNIFWSCCSDIEPDSLKHILRQRQSSRPLVPGSSERVKRFYQNQDDLIDGYDRMEKRANNDPEEQNKNENLNRKTKRMTYIMSRVSLAVNVVSNSINSMIYYRKDFRYYFSLKLWLQCYPTPFRSFQRWSIRRST